MWSVWREEGCDLVEGVGGGGERVWRVVWPQTTPSFPSPGHSFSSTLTPPPTGGSMWWKKRHGLVGRKKAYLIVEQGLG